MEEKSEYKTSQEIKEEEEELTEIIWYLQHPDWNKE